MADGLKVEKNVLILYEESDAADWARCIQKEMTDNEPKITGVEILDLNSNLGRIGNYCSPYMVIVMLISPEMLGTMETHVEMIAPCLGKHKHVAGVRLFIEEELDKLKDSILPKFANHKLWQMYDVTSTDPSQLRKAVANILDLLQFAKTEDVKPKVIKHRKAASFISHVSPDTIRTGGETVTVVLTKPEKTSEGKTIQVAIDDAKAEKIDTIILNEYCFTFKAPPHQSGRAMLYIFIDGEKKCKRPVDYSSFRKFAYTFPDFLCQLLGFESEDQDRLDKYLTNLYRNSMPQDGSVGTMLTPKNIALEAGRKHSCDELPTLLHFACKYNLTNLASAILDSAGAVEALDVLNCENMSPLDIAEEMENHELVKYIEVLMEMQDYMTDLESIYEKMSNGQSLPENYIKMSPSYIEGRLPQSDYEIRDPSLSINKVQEVDEDDDVHEQAPPVPARSHSYNTRTSTDTHPPTELPSSSYPPVTSHHDTYHRDTLPPVPTRPSRPSQSEPSVQQMNDMCAIPPDDPMAGNEPLSEFCMGSSSLNELYGFLEDFKRGELSVSDCEKLYNAWQTRNRGDNPSIKEKKEKLEYLKSIYEKKRGDERKKEKGFFSRFTKRKKETNIPIDIQHNIKPARTTTNYESWPLTSPSEHRKNRLSTISNASTSSSSSTGSRDSMLDPLVEREDTDSDMEEDEVFSLRPTPRRLSSGSNRNSWGNQYMQKAPPPVTGSRLPKPPPGHPDVQTLVQARDTPTPPVPARRPQRPKT